MIRFQKVYNLLNDEESRDIFIKKMMFYITNDYSLVFEIVSFYVKTYALHGVANIIKKYRPKLAISVYHRSSHMIDIPLYLKTLIPDYKLYIRHYSIYPQETILYAI